MSTTLEEHLSAVLEQNARLRAEWDDYRMIADAYRSAIRAVLAFADGFGRAPAGQIMKEAIYQVVSVSLRDAGVEMPT